MTQKIYSSSIKGIIPFFLSIILMPFLTFTSNKNPQKQYIHTLLTNPQASQRRFAALILDQYPQKNSINALIKALDDNDPHVRKNATRSLAKLKASQAIPKIIQLLSEDQLDLQNQAIRSLGHLKSHQAVTHLIDKLKNTSHSSIKISSIVSLAKIKDRQALRSIIQSLFDPNPSVRSSAAQATSHFKNQATIPFLKLLYQKDPNLRVRQSAALSLKKLGLPTQIPTHIP